MKILLLVKTISGYKMQKKRKEKKKKEKKDYLL